MRAAGDDDGEGGAALSDEELAQRGDEICRSAQDEVAELRREPPTTPQQSARFTERLIGIFEREVSRLRVLEPPPDNREALERYLRARDEAIEGLERGLGAARREDAVAYAKAQGAVAEGQVERAQLAAQAGFSQCSRPLTASGVASP